MFRLISFIFILFFFKNNSFCQLRFAEPPNIVVKNDSTFYELAHPAFYSYFKQGLDSIFISFDSIAFYQQAVIDNKTKHGFLEIRYDNQVLVRNEIRDGKVSGIGLLYHPNLLSYKYDLPFCQAQFLNNKLHGVVMFFDFNGLITEILLFKKGNYLRHIYHKKAISDSLLKVGNKFSSNPFK